MTTQARPAQGIPRRDPLIASAIENLQGADEEMRHGLDATASLICVQAIVETLIEKHCGRNK